LGDQAKQAGSWVGPDGLRFDFPASSATPREQLREIERRVNEQIRRNATVEPRWMSLTEAQQLGADMFFGEKYVPERVRVVQVEGFSKELCGGTHVAATGQIGSFRITGESSIGAGLRRVEAVTGEAADELVSTRLEALHAVALHLGVPEEQVPARVEALNARLREKEKGAREPAGGGAQLDAAGALAEAQDAGDSKVVVKHYPEADASALRRWADDLRGITGRFVAVAAGERGGPSVLVAASRDLVSEGFDAVAVIRQVGPMIGGGGGGRPELAQAGGRDASRLTDALAEATRLALEALTPIESG
jgi:alanyl-tRNA synthetase